MKKIFRQVYLTNRFMIAMSVCIFMYALGFAFTWLVIPSIVLLCAFTFLVAGDLAFLFLLLKKPAVSRTVQKILSLGDENPVELEVTNTSKSGLEMNLLDELPHQFQERKHMYRFHIEKGETKNIAYNLTPLSRGEYGFGDLHLFVMSRLKLIERKITVLSSFTASVYPSIVQMRKFELKAFANQYDSSGLKKIRRVGHTYEFEHIRNYAHGDDQRSINWKATGKRGDLMVNQFEDERSQQVFCIIDKSRVMHMPFDGLSLLDYAINTSLVLTNIVLKKHDKAGLITFSDKIGVTLQADRSRMQLKRIMEDLYREEARSTEANYELLYLAVKKLIRGRSLILLFTNFENIHALQRVLPLLKNMGRGHLLVPVFFENTGITAVRDSSPADMESLFIQTAAEQYTSEKLQMIQMLQQAGLSPIYTKPADLTMNTVNKYLELKAKGWI